MSTQEALDRAMLYKTQAQDLMLRMRRADDFKILNSIIDEANDIIKQLGGLNR